ncbi:unnamed protein product [Danaus chrysippus]|uniref:(African queen) hypothetical protein n=1 Tax=Danaus chrysippus TaxID=151541 RepID=A0A8J2QZ41_9NEOP|nr:unnamed protein product [Danaus chrysippus]
MLYRSIVMLCVVTWSATGERHGLWRGDDYNIEAIDNWWDNYDKQMDNLNKELRQQTRTEIVGDQYWVYIEMPGFNTEDISVKSKKGLLVVRAARPLNDYQHVSALPDYVDEHGSWSYNHGLLTVVYPLERRPPTDASTSRLYL